jgi:hypothetical protein
MLRLMVIFIFAFQGVTFGQSFSGQVFRLAENFLEDKCEAFAGCDCCSTDIFFISTNKFCFVSRCISGDSYFTGTYLTKSDKLKLTFDKKYVDEITDEDYNVIKLETKTKAFDPIEFDISKCGQMVRLTRLNGELKNGSRYEEKKESAKISKLTTSKAWQELSK